MTKRELISKMADDSGITRKDTEKVLNAFISEVTLALKKRTSPSFWPGNLSGEKEKSKKRKESKDG